MRIPSLIVLIMFAMVGAVGMQAGTITFSSVGTAADPLQFQGHGASLAIEQHPRWATPLDGSSWVSHGTTGNPDAAGYFVPAAGTVVPFFQLFALPALPCAASVTFRADDSAALYVNGALVVPEGARAGNHYSLCSDFPVGCLVRTQVTVDITPYLISGGYNILRFDVAQRGGWSFGLNYSGTATWNDTPTVFNPEPTTFVMLGLGFATIVLYRRKQ